MSRCGPRALDRRRVLLGLCAAAAIPLASTATAGPAPQRIAAFDWGSIETLLALGVVPAAAAETDGYRTWVVKPALPDDVIDLGLRTEPNLELLARLAPEAIVITPQYQGAQPIFERIAPTWTFALTAPEQPPLAFAKAETLRLARWLGREDEGQRLTAQVEATLAASRTALRNAASRPVYLVNFLDARHVRVYGGQSIFQGVLEAVGLTNAWRGGMGPAGFATVGFEQLAAEPEARLVSLDPLPAESETTLARSPLWKSLPFVREDRMTRLPPVWSFGSLPSAQRLARLLAENLPVRTAS